jgi:hypothetical protein
VSWDIRFQRGRQVLVHRCVEIEFVLGHQLHCRDIGESLGDRTDSKQSRIRIDSTWGSSPEIPYPRSSRGRFRSVTDTVTPAIRFSAIYPRTTPSTNAASVAGSIAGGATISGAAALAAAAGAAVRTARFWARSEGGPVQADRAAAEATWNVVAAWAVNWGHTQRENENIIQRALNPGLRPAATIRDVPCAACDSTRC